MPKETDCAVDQAVEEQKELDRIKEEELRAIFEGFSSGKYRFEYRRVPLFSYSFLAQMRKTIDEEGIVRLAEDIALHGIINAPVIARLDLEHLKAYVQTNNKVWRVENHLPTEPSITINGIDYYDVLIAGERRTRACRYLWENGCDVCREKYAESNHNWLEECRKKHFPGGKIGVSVAINIPAEVAMSIQFTENTYDPPLPEEEAMGHDHWFVYLKDRFGDRINLSIFASTVGRSESKVRDSLAFAGLPKHIQEMVSKSRNDPSIPEVSYSFALQISRLQRHFGYNEEQTMNKFRQMMTAGFHLNLNKCREYVSGLIKNSKGSQKSLMDFFDESCQKQLDDDNRKRVAEAGLLRAAHQGIAYLQGIKDLFKRGLLGVEDSIFSMNSVVKVFLKLVCLMEEIYPYVLNHLPDSQKEISDLSIARVIARMQITLKRLDQSQVVAKKKRDQRKKQKKSLG